MTSKPFAGFERGDAPVAAEFDTEAEAVDWLSDQGPDAFVEDTPRKRVLWFVAGSIESEPLVPPEKEYIFVSSTVEHPGGTDEQWFTMRRDQWEKMTTGERDALLVEYAIEHQNNVAPCGASEVTPDAVPDNVRDNPEGYVL